MNDLGQLLCILVSVTGGAYCIAVLRDFRRPLRLPTEPANARRRSARRNPVCARINRLCQILLAAVFIAVAGSLLAGFAYETFSVASRGRADGRGGPLSFETVAIPGCPPVAFDYDMSRMSRSVVGIDCAAKPVSDDHLRRLLREAPTLSRLNLAGTRITDDALRDVSRATTLQALCLNRTQIGDQGLRHLANLQGLETLNLDETAVTDKGLRYLADLQRLEVLSLDKTSITDEGLRCLVGLKSLRRLSLRDTAIANAGLLSLEHLDRLASLTLWNTKVTREGIERLKARLPNVEIDHREWNDEQPSVPRQANCARRHRSTTGRAQDPQAVRKGPPK